MNILYFQEKILKNNIMLVLKIQIK